jgi:hypothetical protein
VRAEDDQVGFNPRGEVDDASSGAGTVHGQDVARNTRCAHRRQPVVQAGLDILERRDRPIAEFGEQDRRLDEKRWMPDVECGDARLVPARYHHGVIERVPRCI